jgi:hypothetical protein
VAVAALATILALNDSECTTICRLTTAAMLDPKAMLGPASTNRKARSTATSRPTRWEADLR